MTASKNRSLGARRLGMTACRPSLEPQGDPVPGSLEKTRHRDALQGDDRIFSERLALVRNAQGGDALAGGEGRDQGLLADDLRVQPVWRARGHRYVQVRRVARAQGALAALP